jgi:hypothetical protein
MIGPSACQPANDAPCRNIIKITMYPARKDGRAQAVAIETMAAA